MNSVQTEGRWLEVQKRIKVIRHGEHGVRRVELTNWYGRLKMNGRWTWFKLFTDRRASQQRWNEIVRDQELRQAGVITPQMDSAQRPLADHLAEYFADLKRRTSGEHCRITENMLNRLVGGAGWKALSEIDEPSTQKILANLQGERNYTVAHVNKFLTKLKSFLHWCVPDRLPFNPLRKLKKGNERKALKRRAKRPLTPHEVLSLLQKVSSRRRLKYAIAIYAGLRRNEAAKLTWGDLKFNAVIPHIVLRAETTKTGQAATLPLHPYLVNELRELTPGMPGAPVFDSIPDKRTIKQDLLAAKIEPSDEHGRRAGYHGLRYTFASLLDETGCSHGTRRALMRHGGGDMTDGYTVARLSEMYEAVKRLPSPLDAKSVTIVKTGTADSVLPDPKQVDTWWTRDALAPTFTGANGRSDSGMPNTRNRRKIQGFSDDRRSAAVSVLLNAGTPDILSKSGSRSSIG
ncbi:MAG: tyrosine-type recombinase/integrase [Tepidisphaeraceae bacterium]